MQSLAYLLFPGAFFAMSDTSADSLDECPRREQHEAKGVLSCSYWDWGRESLSSSELTG